MQNRPEPRVEPLRELTKPDDSGAESLIVLSEHGPSHLLEGAWHGSAGGLVPALEPLLLSRHGVWVNAALEQSAPPLPEVAYRRQFVSIPREREDAARASFSDGVLWPTMHGLPVLADLDHVSWTHYEAVNRRFAEVALAEVGEESLLWVHDYHLMRTPRLLRNTQCDLRIGWSCHVPWPALDQFATLPWRRQLVEGVLGADVISFHSSRYAQHFLDCAEAFAGAFVDRERGVAITDEVRSELIVEPVGIPTREVRALAQADELTPRIDRLLRAVEGRRIVLGVDCLDHTKGLVEKMAAYARLLETSPDLVDDLVLIQIVEPSRETIDAHSRLKRELDRVVGDLNGRFARTGKVPVHYLYQRLEPLELYAHYRAADVALVTPLRDGMNLVALEYVAARVDGDGALVLSEFTGAAEYLDDAYLVNPHDTDAVCSALVRALNAPRDERRQKMSALRRKVVELDVHGWADRVLGRVAASLPALAQAQ